MAKASDNLFPSVLFVEGSAPASPASGDQRIFIDVADHKLKRKDNGGTVTTIESGGGSTTLAGDTDANISSPANHDLLQYSTSDSKWHNVAIGSTVTNALTADVPMGTLNTYFDGPAVSLTAGVWLLVGSISFKDSGPTDDFTARLWDGTTVVMEAEMREATATITYALSVMGALTVATTATAKISLAHDSTTGTIVATCRDNATAHKASVLTAVRIA